MPSRKLRIDAFVVACVSLSIFLFFQAQGIFGGDSGDLVTAAYELGVPHPPGYPLYTLLTWMATRMPLFTPAWRAGLVSSVPHAAALSIVYLIIRNVGGSRLAGYFGSSLLAGNYLFVLYSVTPEVFALFDLFVVLVVYLVLIWQDTKRRMVLYLFSFVLGLSLTHHHVIVFLAPAVGYVLYASGIHEKKHIYVRMVILFALGLVPYLYIPIAAGGAAIVNWDRAVDWAGFARLITRQDYGSFVANGFYGSLPIHRILQISAFGEFFRLDFTWIGLWLLGFGAVFLYRRRPALFWFFLIAIALLGPGFLFYASFPLMNRFSLGTYERFLLPSYLLIAVVMGIGFDQPGNLASYLLRRTRMRSRLIAVTAVSVGLLLFLLPVSSGLLTYYRFWGLGNDRTADNLGRDIMVGLPRGSILLVSRDTPLFVSQYVRYGLGFRPDIMLIHANRLWSSDYPESLKLRFPLLAVPREAPEAFARAFVRSNRDNFPIYSNTTVPVDDGWFWVPHGFVYRLTEKNDLPDITSFLSINDGLWNSFHDSRNGILARYRHLMLSDILSVYADARMRTGKILLRAGKLADAKRYFREAISYRSDIEEQDGYTYLGLAELFDGNCFQALDAFRRARETSIVPDTSLILYESVAERDACGNREKAEELMRIYESARQREDIQLGKGE